MSSPFPGMDPYLEHPELWPVVHHRLIVAIADILSVELRPKYSVSLEVRMYETSYEQSVPIAVRQGYLEIKEVATKEVVTALEVLSPVNKRSGKGRDAYLAKREKIFFCLTNFVEIYLLRSGEAMPIDSKEISSHYRILVSRGHQRPQADLYAFNIQNEISSFPVPLRREDPEPVIDLRALLTNIYEVGGYDLKIDYSKKPVPRLSEKDETWADAFLRQQGLR